MYPLNTRYSFRCQSTWLTFLVGLVAWLKLLGMIGFCPAQTIDPILTESAIQFPQKLPLEGSNTQATDKTAIHDPQGPFVSGMGIRPQAEQLVQIALDNHPELAQAMADIDRQSGLRFQATRRFNPTVGYAASEVFNEGRAGQQGMFVAQEFITAGKRQLADQVGHWRTLAARERLRWSCLRLNRRVQSQYWALVAARQRVELLTQIENLLGRAVETNTALLNAGEATRGTLLQAQLEYNQLGVSKRQATIDLQAKTKTLAATLGVDLSLINDIRTDPWPRRIMLPSADEEVQAAITVVGQDVGSMEWLESVIWEDLFHSPELGEVNALLEAARWNQRLAEAQVVSNIQSQTTLQHDAITNHVVLGVQIGAALPIRDNKQGLVKAARAEVLQYDAQLQARHRDLQVRWARALSDYQSALQMAETVEESLQQLVQERLDLAMQAHQEGEIDYLELLTAQRSYLSIQQMALDAQEQLALAIVNLQTYVVEDQPISAIDSQVN